MMPPLRCAVVVLDENSKVLHSQLVPEIGEEPDYEAAPGLSVQSC
jgi:hypothetical protein